MISNEIVDKIISTHSFKKRDCDTLLRVTDLIETGRKNATGFSASCDIPISSIGAHNLSYNDFKTFDQILFEITGRHTFVVENKSYFEPNGRGWMYDDELKEKSDKYVVLRLNRFLYAEIKEIISTLRSLLPDNTGLIRLRLEENVLERNMDGKVLICRFNNDEDPLILLEDLFSSKKPRTRTQLGKDRNWSRVVKQINSRACDELELPSDEPLIINKKGYMINDKKYQIL